MTKGRRQKAQGRDPETREEWQEAVDLAYSPLCLDGARQYGLVTGGPAADIDRRDTILNRGRERGITPAPDAVERILRDAALIAEYERDSQAE